MSETDDQQIAFRYDPERNPEGAALPGVPLRSLTVRMFRAQPAHIQASIRAQPCYIATANAPKAEAEPESAEEPRARRRRGEPEEPAAPAA